MFRICDFFRIFTCQSPIFIFSYPYPLPFVSKSMEIDLTPGRPLVSLKDLNSAAPRSLAWAAQRHGKSTFGEIHVRHVHYIDENICTLSSHQYNVYIILSHMYRDNISMYYRVEKNPVSILVYLYYVGVFLRFYFLWHSWLHALSHPMAVRCWMCLWGHWPCPTGTIVFFLQVFFGGWFLRHRNILRSRCVPQVFLADVGILRFWQSFCRSPHLEAEQTRQAVVAQATAGYGALIWATESQIFGTSAGNVNPVSPTPYDPDICYFSPFGTESWKKHKKAGRIMSAQRQPFWFCCLLLLKLCSI